MTKATTEIFAEMTVEFETTGGALPAPVSIVSISNANPAVCTVGAGDISKFTAAMSVTLSNIPSPNTAINGAYVIGTPTGNTFTLVGLNGTTITGAPLTQTNAPGMTVTPALAGTLVWSKICGITSRTVNRTTTMQSTEIPDCADETIPNYIEKSVQSLEETISGTGVWAAESHGSMINWWRSGARKGIKVSNTKALTGTIKEEWGYAYLTQLNNAAVKGAKVTSDIQIEFDGLPAVTLAP
jgi:hypothetical protein